MVPMMMFLQMSPLPIVTSVAMVEGGEKKDPEAFAMRQRRIWHSLNYNAQFLTLVIGQPICDGSPFYSHDKTSHLQ